MNYFQTTITRKGQITFPKAALAYLGLKTLRKVKVSLQPGRKIKITPLVDIVDLAGKYRPKKVYPATKLREKLEKNYDRC